MDVEDRESPFDVASDRCGLPSVHLSTDEDSDGEWQPLLVSSSSLNFQDIFNSQSQSYT